MIIISYLLDILHLFVVFSPILIYLIPFKFNILIKLLILGIILTPVHWNLQDDYCILSKYSMKFGGLKDAKTSSPFSEKYLMWLYKPLMNLFNIENNSEGLSKIINIHWFINLIIIWYYIFFVYCK